MTKREFKVLSPTAILGYGFPEASFLRGIEQKPDLIAVDAGSTDPGPFYLGAGKAFTDREFVKRDLKYMICAGVQHKIPVVVGTAGGSGADVHLEWCRQIIEEIAKENNLTFSMAVIPCDVSKENVKIALDEGRIVPLAYVPELTKKDIDDTTYVVAQIGPEPIIEALKDGCDVVLTGRCYDPACFAALPIMKGYDPGLALHMGKILECAAIAATPGSGSDCAMGTLTEDSFILEALSPDRVFTCESAAAHTLYEKTDPYHLPGPGGEINLENCSFKDLGNGRVEVKGSKFVPTEKFYLKLEGAKCIGYRTISIAGTHDPIMIANIDKVLQQVKERINVLSGDNNRSDNLFFHVYGKNGVMGSLEPNPNVKSHELCIVIEALCPTQDQANTLCSVARSTMLHYGYEGRVSTAGNLAFPFSPSDITVGKVFEFSIYHLMDTKNEVLFKHRIEKYEQGTRK
ncbi:MAG: acyclic terpene utilization AtuA family protein [Candidatus Riflebacteria bacterium]|nr:acyclic terpene utilization AtuA family protein [Candidatus Riflebacteria bacterium]